MERLENERERKRERVKKREKEWADGEEGTQYCHRFLLLATCVETLKWTATAVAEGKEGCV